MEDRFALYYPYIHFRDTNWLKNAILTFGQVRRMVPEGFQLRDEFLVNELRGLQGAGGAPLLVEEPLGNEAVLEAHRRLTDHLLSSCFAPAAFSRDAVRMEGLKEFEIISAKMTGELFRFLWERGLTWSTNKAYELDHTVAGHSSLGLHPRLGEALMSVTAIAIARQKGLSIVTAEERFHHALATYDENAVFDALSRPRAAPSPVGVKTDELLQAVLIHTFDLSALSANDIASLARETDALRKLRLAMEQQATAIPPIADSAERERRVKSAAKKIQEEWGSSKKNAVWEGVKTAVDLSTLDLPATVNGLIAGATIGTVSLGAGLAIAFVTYAGIRAWKGYREAADSPYRYLTLVGDRVKVSALSTMA